MTDEVVPATTILPELSIFTALPVSELALPPTLVEKIKSDPFGLNFVTKTPPVVAPVVVGTPPEAYPVMTAFPSTSTVRAVNAKMCRKKNRNRSMRRVKKLKRVKRNMKRNRNKNMKKNNNMRKEMNSNHRNMRKKDNMKKDNLRKDNLIWPTDNTKYITKTKLSNYPPTHQIMIKEPPYKSQILNKLRNHL